jgi:large subunit ribosomal protein L7/L12
MFEGLELAAPSTPDVDENAAEAEKEAYDIVMTEFDPAGKLKIIKELKGMLGLGLLEAKSLVESVLKEPIIIFKRVSKDHEQEAIDKLVGLGAKLEYR